MEEYVMGGDRTRFRQERRGVGRQNFVRGGATGGTASPARAGGRRAASWDFSGEDRRGWRGEKITTTGRKTTRTSDGEGQPKKKARAEMPGGGCSGGAITIRPWSFRGRRSRPCRPRGCTSRPRVFLRVRIRSLVDSGDDAGADRPGGGEEDDEYDNDVSYLVNEGARRCTSAPRWRTPHPPP